MEQPAVRLRFRRRIAGIGQTLQAQELKLHRIGRDLSNLSIPKRLLPQLRHLDTRGPEEDAEAEAQVVVSLIEDLLDVYVEVGLAGASASAATQLVLLGDALPVPIPLYDFLPARDDDLRKACCCLDSVSSQSQELQDVLGDSLASLYALRFLLPAQQFAVPYKVEVESGLRNAAEKANVAANWAIAALEVMKESVRELALYEQLKERQEMENKLQKIAKQMDYLERAKRQEEAPLIEQAFQKRLEREIELSEQHHAWLSRMLEHRNILKERIVQRHEAEFSRLKKERDERTSQLISSRKRERDTVRKLMYYLNLEEQRLQRLREEEEARKREEEERRKRDETENEG